MLIFSDNPVFIEESEPEPQPQDDVIEEVHSDSQSLISAHDESFLSDYSEQEEEEEEEEVEVENEVVNQGLYKL